MAEDRTPGVELVEELVAGTRDGRFSWTAVGKEQLYSDIGGDPPQFRIVMTLGPIRGRAVRSPKAPDIRLPALGAGLAAASMGFAEILGGGEFVPGDEVILSAHRLRPDAAEESGWSAMSTPDIRAGVSELTKEAGRQLDALWRLAAESVVLPVPAVASVLAAARSTPMLKG